MTKKKKVEEVEEVIPESLEQPEEQAEPSATEEITVESSPLEKRILEVYDAASEGTVWTLKELAEAVHAPESSVALAWHRLFDQHKVESTSFVKP